MSIGIFYGFCDKDGNVHLDFPSQQRAFCKAKFSEDEVVVTIERKAAAKTRLQEKGFHAMLKPWLAEGHSLPDLKRDILAAIWGTRPHMDPISGAEIQVLVEPMTRALSKAKYSELIERTLELAAGCGVILEAPNEYRERKERERKAAARKAIASGRRG